MKAVMIGTVDVGLLSFPLNRQEAVEGAEVVFFAVSTPTRRANVHAHLTYVMVVDKGMSCAASNLEYLREYPIVTTDLELAEMIERPSNAFLALKITLNNATAALCEKVGALDLKKIAKKMTIPHMADLRNIYILEGSREASFSLTTALGDNHLRFYVLFPWLYLSILCQQRTVSQAVPYGELL